MTDGEKFVAALEDLDALKEFRDSGKNIDWEYHAPWGTMSVLGYSIVKNKWTAVKNLLEIGLGKDLDLYEGYQDHEGEVCDVWEAMCYACPQDVFEFIVDHSWMFAERETWIQRRRDLRRGSPLCRD